MVNFPESLNYLIEYGISGAKNPDGHFNLDSHWLADTYFVPSYEHLNMAHEISKIKGKNCIFLGYPKLDVFFDENYQPKDVWKKQNKPKKRIIWAPHWLYDAAALYSTSTFAEIYDFMFELADKYKDEIQFAFCLEVFYQRFCDTFTLIVISLSPKWRSTNLGWAILSF